MKIYKIRKRMSNPLLSRNIIGWKVPFYEATVNDKPLPSKMVNPEADSKKRGTAFAYGYHGVLPTNLAVSILCDFFEIEDYTEIFAESGYGTLTNRFYEDFICENNQTSWQITEEQILDYSAKVLEDLEKEGLIHEEA